MAFCVLCAARGRKNTLRFSYSTPPHVERKVTAKDVEECAPRPVAKALRYVTSAYLLNWYGPVVTVNVCNRRSGAEAHLRASLNEQEHHQTEQVETRGSTAKL